jgi:arylsulfatase A-like enzyme
MVTMRRGFIEGARTGFILAIVECLIRSIVNPLLSPFVTADALTTIYLPFVVYPLLLAGTTAVTALLIRSHAEQVAIGWMAVGVAAACAPIVRTGTRFGIIAAAAIAIASSVAAPGLLNAWSASALLVAPPWVTRELLRERPRRVKALVIAVLFIAFIAIVLIGRKKMPRRAPVVPIGAAVGFAALLLNPNVHLSHPRQQPARRPNIVLITLDTVRADHISAYGYSRNTAPELAAFSRHATLYRSAVAPSNFTLPSHTSIFTGLYGTVHGNQGLPGNGLSTTVATLPETLRDFGYQAIAVVANSAYLQSPFGLDRGFQYHDSRWRIDLDYSPRDALLFLRRRADLTASRRADEIEAEGEAVLRRAARSSHPFFLFLNFMDAHAPYVPPGAFGRLFPGRVPGLRVELLLERLARQMPHARPSPAERAHLISQYDGGIAFEDHVLGRFFDALNDTGVADNTLVIITADHGEVFGEHGYVEHRNSLYDPELRVPLLIKYPRQQQGAVSASVVSLNDLYPTILKAAGIAPPHPHHGVALQDVQPAGRIVMSEMFEGGVRRSAFDGRWKSIVGADGGWEVFDIANDPGELHPLAVPPPAAEKAAIETLSHEKSLGARTTGLTDEQIFRLRALGYLQ